MKHLAHLCALGLALTGGAALAQAQTQPRGPLPSINMSAPPSAMDQAPHLPEGALQEIGTTPGQVHFMALGDIADHGDVVEATLLTVNDPAQPVAGKAAAMIVSRQATWCASHTFAAFTGWYGADGRLLDAVRAFEPKPLAPGTAAAVVAARVCDKAPAGETVSGHAAALAAGQAQLRAPR